MALTSCTSWNPEARRLAFKDRPYGESMPLKTTTPQRGDRSLQTPDKNTFRELTVAQGSGFSGFNSVRIFADGTGYATIIVREGRARRLPIQLTDQQLSLLLAAIQKDRLTHLAGSYSSGANDGVQGFVEIVTSHGRAYTWLDNYFAPVTHVYEFCNQNIFPHLNRNLARRWAAEKVDPQAAYHRVFD